jgi:uncharacterized protein
MIGRVLVAGFATRHVVQSAYHAGYEVYAVDHFCDQDLIWYTRDRRRFDDLNEITRKIEDILQRHPIDLLVVTSGAESIRTLLPICGTPPDIVEGFLDKLQTQQFFEGRHIPTPPLAGDDEYPAMIKPRKGAGGWRNRVVFGPEEKAQWMSLFPDMPHISQRVVLGTPASVSCLSDGRRGQAVAANLQILRGDASSTYGFSGSATPFVDHPLVGEMIRRAEEIAAASGCLGSIGVDFVLGEEHPWAIEVNPRFQATVDTIEMATGVNLFSLHLDACRGRLPAGMPENKRFAVRRILFAERDQVVKADLAAFTPSVADIPWPGTHLEEGQAVVSVYGWGSSLQAAEAMLAGHTERVQRSLSA